MGETADNSEEILKIVLPCTKPDKCAKVGGLYFTLNEQIINVFDPRQIVKDLPRMKGREDDVIVCGCHRSGTNWTWEIVNMLVQKEARYQTDRKTATLLEFQKQAFFDSLTSPRVLSTHLRFQHIPDDMKNRKCKIIYVQRNPKDAAISFLNYMRTEFDMDMPLDKYIGEYVNADEDIYTSWFGITKSWEKAMEDNPEYPILLVYYEEMKRNPTQEIQRMADFLGVSSNEKLIKDIVDKTMFSNMRKAKLDFLSNGSTNDTDEGDAYKRRESYYRKGEVGDWKTHFTVAQNEYFDELLDKRLKDTKYRFIYSI